MQRIEWSDEAFAGLCDTFRSTPDFDAVATVREGVRSGLMELWRVGGHSYAVTQSWRNPSTGNGEMLLWCYQGRGLNEFVDYMMRVAKANKFSILKFATLHRGIPRMLRRYNPRNTEQDIFEIEVTL